jgi:GntR family transcriptional regulator / MocR family aminotransferase
VFWLAIDRSQDTPLIRQVFEQLRVKILSGELNAGEQLPSSRALAGTLQVSRNVVLEAYEQLMAEGYIETRQGAGTFVCAGTYLRQSEQWSVSSKEEPEGVEGTTDLHGQHFQEPRDVINFRSGIPALDMFPRKIWAKLSQQVCLETEHTAFGYDQPAGRPELRTALCRYLLKTRGVQCRPEQLIITSGATQAFTLITKLLLTANDSFLIEDPVTNDIQTIFSATGARMTPVPVDDTGMQTDLLPHDQQPKFVFVTPSHQFPLGSTMLIQRRIDLIEYARSRTEECYIVEDDYDSEFRHEGPPIHSLQGLEPEKVIYVGTFSKILSPALRIGYMVLPANLVEEAKRQKWHIDLHTPSIEQLILARFIQEGALERHIARMKKQYQKRRDILIKHLQYHFGQNINICGHSTGLHLIVEWTSALFSEKTFYKTAEYEYGVKVYSVEDHAIEKGRHGRRSILGYGHLSTEQIAEGVHRLKKAITGLSS